MGGVRFEDLNIILIFLGSELFLKSEWLVVA